jgi:hypothetical protein
VNFQAPDPPPISGRQPEITDFPGHRLRQDYSPPLDNPEGLEELFSRPAVFKRSRHDHERGPIDLIYHRVQLVVVWAALQTIAFPVEHFIWERVIGWVP